MTKDFWDNRWLTGQTGWDLGQVSPPLKAYIDQIKNRSTKILIPGCGNAYEAEYLIRNGFDNVYIVEISEKAIATFKARFPDFPNNHIFHADFFELTGQFDLIIEQTFFCAILPELRLKYVDKMTELLNPNGKLVGLLFNRGFSGGPPFGGSLSEYQGLFQSKFEIKVMEKCYNSIGPRLGSEIFIKLQVNEV